MWNPLRESGGRLGKSYPDLPPKALLTQYLRTNAHVDVDEFRRAEWFWNRKPRKLLLSPANAALFVMLCAPIWIISTFIPGEIPIGPVIRDVASSTLLAGGASVFVDIFRYAQWKWEYSCAVSRLLARSNR
jgi:hypothetical protein